MKQFKNRRLFVAIALIAMGSGAAVYFVAAVKNAPPMNTLQVTISPKLNPVRVRES